MLLCDLLSYICSTTRMTIKSSWCHTNRPILVMRVRIFWQSNIVSSVYYILVLKLLHIYALRVNVISPGIECIDAIGIKRKFDPHIRLMKLFFSFQHTKTVELNGLQTDPYIFFTQIKSKEEHFALTQTSMVMFITFICKEKSELYP